MPNSSEELLQQHRIQYVETYFDYTNQLLERAETRANYLLVSDSIFVTAVVAVCSVLTLPDKKGLPGVGLVLGLAAAPLALFACSVMFAVLAFLPKVFDYTIPINNETVAKLQPEEFRRFVLQRSAHEMLSDYVDETHVLCQILAYRVSYVTRSARLLFAGVVAAFAATIVGILISTV